MPAEILRRDTLRRELTRREPIVVVTPRGRATVPSDELCRVCRRARVDAASGLLACDLCLTVDAVLGERSGVDQLTPLDPHGTASVLHHRLWGSTDGTSAAGLTAFHDAGLSTMRDLAAAEGTHYLVVTSPRLASRTRLVDWPRWRRRFPPSLAASARAYRAYVTQVHPWVLDLEPQVSEPGWLERLVTRVPCLLR